jgi:tRNA G37 N-methylase Trm5
MLPLIWIAGAALAIGALAIFWKEIKTWIDRVYLKLPPSVKDNLKGLMAFVEKIDSTFKNIMVYYSFREETQKWTETTVSREVDPSTIPKNILQRINSKSKIDITQDLEKELEMAYSH